MPFYCLMVFLKTQQLPTESQAINVLGSLIFPGESGYLENAETSCLEHVPLLTFSSEPCEFWYWKM